MSQEYLKKNVSDIKSVDPHKAALILKKLGGAPGDCEDSGNFTIQSHQALNLSPEESTEKLLIYFTNISQQYEPLNFYLLPVRVRVKLMENEVSVPLIEDYQVYDVIKKSNKYHSVGVPAKLFKSSQ